MARMVMPSERRQGTKKVRQDYGGPVGTVQNADTIHIHNELGRLEGGIGNMPDKAILAPTLVDRGLQLNPLLERLEAMLPTGGALLVIVPGYAADLHEALVIRCGLVAFVDEFGGNGAWQYLRFLEWPDGAGTIEAILRKVRDHLGLDKTYRQADIERSVSRLGRHLSFGHLVDRDSWETDDGALVRQWVDYFARGSVKAGPKCLVVGFLCLEMSEEPTAACRQMQAFLEEAGRTPPGRSGGGVLVTRPLGLIRPRDLVEWRSRVSEYLKDDLIHADLLDVASGLFPPDAPRRRLREIWSEVRGALMDAVKRRPARFADSDQ
jgi:hypothetical protein